MTREQFFNFVRKKEETEESFSRSTKHYMDYFDRLQETGKKFKWNWGSFLLFFTPWSFYRRMYLNGFIALLIGYCIGLFEGTLKELLSPEGFFSRIPGGPFLTSSVLILWLLIIFIALPGYSNYFYFLHASKKIRKGKVRSGPNNIFLTVYFTVIGLVPLSIIIFFSYMAYLEANK